MKNIIALLMLSLTLMIGGCASTRPTIVDLKTRNVKVPAQTVLTCWGDVVGSNPEQRKFHTSCCHGDTLVLRAYDESFRKVAERKVHGPRAYVYYHVRGDKVAFIDCKARGISLFDTTAKTKKIIAVPDGPVCKDHKWRCQFLRGILWISDSQLMFHCDKNVYVTDEVLRTYRKVYSTNSDRSLSDVLPSPDGKRLAIVEKTPYVNGGYDCFLKIVDLGKGNAVRSIARGPGGRWSPDSKKFFFIEESSNAQGAQRDRVAKVLTLDTDIATIGTMETWSMDSDFKQLAYLTKGREIKLRNMASDKVHTLVTLPDNWKRHRLSLQKDVLFLYFQDCKSASEYWGTPSLAAIDLQTSELTKVTSGMYFFKDFYPLDGDGKYITDASRSESNSGVLNTLKMAAWLLSGQFLNGEF